MKRIGLVCAMQQEHECLSLPATAAWESLEIQPFPVFAAALRRA